MLPGCILRNNVLRRTGWISQPPSLYPKVVAPLKASGESFSANPVTGTSSFSIPLPVSPARGFEPQLSLSYDSGAGNRPFGLGWALAVPSIGRKTEKGLPEYLDQDDSDTFVIAGAEDLVPLLEDSGGSWQEVTAVKELAGISWDVKLYRPRIEGGFYLYRGRTKLTISNYKLLD